jgi:hypothetical protein
LKKEARPQEFLTEQKFLAESFLREKQTPKEIACSGRN